MSSVGVGGRVGYVEGRGELSGVRLCGGER